MTNVSEAKVPLAGSPDVSDRTDAAEKSIRVVDAPELKHLRAPEDTSVPPAASAVEVRFVPVEALVVDRRYQRRTSDRSRVRLRNIVAEFCWAKFGAISVATGPDGSFSIIDGQHRALAAAAIGASEVPAVIATASLEDQANDFVGINTVRTSVASIDKFRARVASGDAAAIAVEQMLTELGISTDVPAGAGIKHKETRAVGTLEKLQKRLGKGVLFTTLETLLDAQPGQNNLLTAFAIETTAQVIAKMLEAERPLDRLDRVLADIDFDTLREEAQKLQKLMGGQTAGRGSELLLRSVNKGLREKIE